MKALTTGYTYTNPTGSLSELVTTFLNCAVDYGLSFITLDSLYNKSKFYYFIHV